VLGASGQVLAQADVLVLAGAAATQHWLQHLGHAPWPLSHSTGQVTYWAAAPGGAATRLRVVVAGDGYALQMPLAAGTGLLCGATRHAAAPNDTTLSTSPVTDADHQHNLQRLLRSTGLAPPSPAAELQGRTGWRLHSDDRLPVAGPVPLPQLPTGLRQDQARLWPRESGLFVLTALGARGLTLAPLLARLVAAQAVGAPWPVEQDLAAAVDPARWLVRAARRGGSV
jgi:tRNA 5-methylaminomethyl-2-thiouridine biosynthesis bifunctional protein